MTRSFLSTAIATVIACGMVAPTLSTAALAQTFNGQQLQGHVTYVPAGTPVDAFLTSPIDSAVAKPGDLFNAKLYSPMLLGSDVVLPANTTLEGQVVSSEKSGHAGINGKISLHLTAAITPDGTRFPLSATVATTQAKGIHENKDGDLKGRSTKATVASGVGRTAAWTAGGTLLGICFAPIVAGSVAAGAIAGVATGGGVGLASNLWRKGKDVKIPSGSRLSFTLDQPMSLSSSVAANGNYVR